MAFEATELEHEDVGLRYRRVLLLVGGFLAFTAVLMVALAFFYRANIREARITEPLRTFPGPELQPNPGQDYANFRAGQDRQLQGLSWADRGRNLVHVPIDRAMDYVAGRGATAYDPLEPGPADAKLPPTPADGSSRLSTFPHVAPYGLPEKGMAR